MDKEREEGPRVIERQDLLKIKTKALRLNVWFRALSRTERALTDLTLRCVEKVRSNLLEAAISNIIDKILKALECTFLVRAEEIGSKIAKQLCNIGEQWGNKQAASWKQDKHFITFLGVNSLNS
jgi:hypothetical protein